MLKRRVVAILLRRVQFPGGSPPGKAPLKFEEFQMAGALRTFVRAPPMCAMPRHRRPPFRAMDYKRQCVKGRSQIQLNRTTTRID